MTDTAAAGEAAVFSEWAILELMGHRRLAGLLSEQEIAGKGFLRLDIPGEDSTVATQFYAPGAVYCITPTTEEVARSVAKANWSEPVTRYELDRGKGPYDEEPY